MMRRVALAGAIALCTGSPVFAAGLIRSPNVSTANHSSLSIGKLMFSYNTSNPADPTFIGAPNPFFASLFPTNNRPFQVGTGGNAHLTADVTNANSSSGYGTNQMPHMNWFFSTAASTGNRVALDGASNGNAVIESYSGNTATFTYNNLGNAGQLGGTVNAVLTIKLFEGASTGQTLVDMVMTATRGDTGSNTISFDVGSVVDLDVSGSAGNTATSVAGSPTTEYNFAGASGAFGRIAAAGTGGTYSTSVLARSTLIGTSHMTGSGNLNNTITNGSDTAAGFLWNNISLAPGATQTFGITIALNQNVPEPTALGVLSLAGATLLRRRRA